MKLEPGFHPNISFDDYKSLDAINCSTLKWGDTSMLHLRAALDGEIEHEDTTALNFGRAVHCRLFEPQDFKTRFAVALPCEGVIASGKNAGQPCGCKGDWQG